MHVQITQADKLMVRHKLIIFALINDPGHFG